MEYNENIVVTYTCEACNTTNKVVNPKKGGGRWKCGRCGNIILHRKIIFHETLLLDVRQQLEVILSDLKSIKIKAISQSKVNEIAKRSQKYNSKFENWKDHLSYISSENQKKIILESYKPDLKAITYLAEMIEIEIDDSRWLREKLRNINGLRGFLVSATLTMKAVSAILDFFGYEDAKDKLISFFGLLALEDLTG